MAFIFFFGPECFYQLSEGSTLHQNINSLAWGQSGDTITYQYDANGSLTTKDTSRSDGTSQTVVNTYNLQGRLETVTTKEFDDVTPTPNELSTSTVTYKYNTQGIRISKDVDGTATDYLIDPSNHTGYAQVLEETTSGTTTTYTIGDDVIAQSTNGVTEYLLYDGHGSTRQLVNSSGVVIGGEEYSYDGYGVMLGTDDTAAANAGTSMLYAGEQYDASASMYYNRARYYNQSNGTFNRVDPYSGNTSDPQSLHKYAYVHNNPINGIDPSGMFSLVSVSFSSAIGGMLSAIHSLAVHRAGTRAGDRLLSAYSGYLANNMQKVSDNATIVVHGVKLHPYGERDTFIDQIKDRAPNQDYFDYVWSGFAANGTLPTKWAVNTTHGIATNGLINVIRAIQAKGYNNVNIIAHSWGTVVSRDALNAGVGDINTWITMGSPLPAHTQVPGSLTGTWMNLWHPDDIVCTLAPRLLGATGAGDGGSPLYTRQGIPQYEMPGSYDPKSLEAHGVYWNIPTSLNIIGNQLSTQN